jgi:U3 small nucleolar RNA-associated protein 12
LYFYSVTCVQFVAKTHNFFSSGKDGKVKHWDGDKFHMIQCLEVFWLFIYIYLFHLQGHYAEIWAMCVTTSGMCVLSASQDNAIKIWEQTEELLVLEEEQELVFYILLIIYILYLL